jgi:hypothetical protein
MDAPPHIMTTRRVLRFGHRWLAAVVAAVLLATPLGLTAATEAHANTAPTPSRATIDVFVQGGSVVNPGQTITVRVSIRAAEAQPLPNQAIRLSITEEPFDTESQLRRFLGNQAEVPLRVVDVRLSPEVLEQETSDVRIDLRVPAIALPTESDNDEPSTFASSIYGLQADFLDSIDNPNGSALVTQRQALVVLGSEPVGATARIAPIVPLIIPPTGGNTLSSEELENYAAPGGALDRSLAAVTNYPVTVAVDSRVTLSIEALGDQAPPNTLAWQSGIDQIAERVISLPWADADPLATIAIDTLLYGRLGQYPWIHAEVTPEKLEEVALRSADAILVPSSVIDSDRTIVQLQSAKMIRVDELTSSFLRQSALAPSSDEFEGNLQRAQAIIAARALGESDDILVVHTGRLPVTASVVRLEEILQRLSTKQFAQLVPVPFDTPASEILVSINETPMPREWVQFTDQVRALWEQDVRYVSISDNPEDAILGRWNRYQALFSSTWTGNPSGLAAEWDRAQADSELFRSSVRVEQGSDITVLSDRTDVPVTLRNDLRSTVRVQLVVSPQRAIIRVDEPVIDVTIPAESSIRVSVPITALASGTVTVSLGLQSIGGEPLSEPFDLRVTIRAGWENVITGVLALLIGIVFAVGIYRAVQKRRTPGDDNATAPESDDRS